MSNYPTFNVLADEAAGPAANIGDNRLLQGIGFPLVPVSQAGSGGQYPGPTRVLLGESFAAQTPTALGAAGAIQIAFGAAQGTPADPVQMDSLGTVTFNQTGVYGIDMRITAKRTSNPQSTTLVLRALLDGVQAGNPIAVVMGDNADSQYEQYTIAGSIPAGTTLRWEVMREGFDDGGLLSLTTGWGPTPSALIRILKF